MSELFPRFSNPQIQDFARQHYSLNLSSCEDIGSFIDQNFKLVTTDGRQYVFKVHAANEHDAVLDMQTVVMLELQSKLNGVKIPHVYSAINGALSVQLTGQLGQRFTARLLSYLSGDLLESDPQRSLSFWQHLGTTIAAMDSALVNFYHPAVNRPNLVWDLKNAHHQRCYLQDISDVNIRRTVDYFLLQYEDNVLPILGELPQQTVHNDINRHAIIVDPTKPDKIKAIFDFGDCTYTHRIMNIAIALTYACFEQSDPLLICSTILKAYQEGTGKKNDLVAGVTERELEVLYYLITTRISVYLLVSSHHAKLQPDNKHSQMKRELMADALQQWLAISPLKAQECFRLAVGYPSLLPQHKICYQKSKRDRQQHVVRNLAMHYKNPLRITGAALEYMYDDQGNSYLDCVNNVCQWGHCHPSVVRANRQQMAKLNTNSRYLYDELPAYAKRLTNKFPSPLNVVMFVNSGTEANDLALRLARTYTGRKDILVMEKAYHGNSSAVTEISPNRLVGEGRPGLPDHVHAVMLTDTFRGEVKAHESHAGEFYAQSVKDTLDRLDQQNRQAAAFVCESFVGTGGQYRLPDNYLQHAYGYARERGLLCIADEVQMGFGRSGDMWCFESQEVIPDIVVLGKPIGNGHPMAAVVTTEEIAEAFNNGIPFFNTFGGNPVSCATGMAVLDVLENEGLITNVNARHQQLLQGFKSLQEQYSVIGDVRGIGLYMGVEIVKGNDDLTPNGDLANQIVEAMLVKGILVNTNGDDKNILKIKPVLIINQTQTQRVIDTLDEVLQELTK